MSPASKAQQKAVNKYMKNNYDRINLVMPKGKKKVIQAHAAQQGESVNAYINRAIDKAMSEDDKYKVTIDVTDYEWKELLHMCIDLHMSPDALATAFCKEVIRQQALLRIIAAALEEKYDGMLDDIREL